MHQLARNKKQQQPSEVDPSQAFKRKDHRSALNVESSGDKGMQEQQIHQSVIPEWKKRTSLCNTRRNRLRSDAPNIYARRIRSYRHSGANDAHAHVVIRICLCGLFLLVQRSMPGL